MMLMFVVWMQLYAKQVQKLAIILAKFPLNVQISDANAFKFLNWSLKRGYCCSSLNITAESRELLKPKSVKNASACLVISNQIFSNTKKLVLSAKLGGNELMEMCAKFQM